MLCEKYNTLSLFRELGEPQTGSQPEISEEDKAGEKESGSEKYILCRQCHQVITSKGNRIKRDGAHRHTFANPSGHLFEIGCFRNVTGCGYAAVISDEFTWFKGYGWRVVVCGMCLTHLGWLFISSGGDSFHGLILNRLIEPGYEG